MDQLMAGHQLFRDTDEDWPPRRPDPDAGTTFGDEREVSRLVLATLLFGGHWTSLSISWQVGHRLALVAERARGAVVAAARTSVEQAQRFFTIVREWARSAVSAAALREEYAALSGGHLRGARRGVGARRVYKTQSLLGPAARMLSLELGLPRPLR